MDFFQAQDNAIRSTKRLVIYYCIAVCLIVVAVYLAVTIGFVAFDNWSRGEGGTAAYAEPVALFDPMRLLATALGVILVVGMGSAYKTLALRGGGAAVATSLGGERVDRSTRDPRRRQLVNVVEEMAIASGVPVPEIYILTQEASINAFAAGWGTDDAVIAVSAGALQQLNRDELQGVVAHEYSHILHGDCRLNIRLMGLLFGIMMLTVFGRLMGALFRGGSRRGGTVIYMGGGRRRRSSGDSGKGGGGAAILAVILVVVLITVIGYIGTFFGRLIQAAISRQREYLADASAVQFTRNPEGISGALKKIGGHPTQALLEHPNASEAAHMFFAQGLKSGFASMLASHPPLNERIRAIEPNWDGSFPQPARVRPKATPPAADVPEKAAATGKSMIESMAMIGAIGTLSRESIATAHTIKEQIPEALDDLVREPAGARQAIIALVVLDNPLDDAAQWTLLESALPADFVEETRTVLKKLEALPRKARLAILELATATLTPSLEADRDDFLSLLNNLIQVDEHLSLYEFCIRRILRERLTRGSRAAATETKVQYLQLKPAVANAVGNLLSVVAREASSKGKASDLFEGAVRSQYLLQGKVTYEPSAEGELARLNRSLGTLRASAFAIRAQCLRAVVAAFEEDGQLTATEAETLRMISLSLGCPTPPLGAN